MCFAESSPKTGRQDQVCSQRRTGSGFAPFETIKTARLNSAKVGLMSHNSASFVNLDI